MPSKTFYPSKEQSLADFGGSGLGTSREIHFVLGRRPSDGAKFREIIRFTLDFTDVVSVSSAILRLKTTTGIHLSHSSGVVNIDIGRCTEAFTSSGGGSHAATGVWESSADENWDTYPFGTKTTNVQSNTISSPNNSTVYDLDITSIVNDWFTGSANYGLMLKVDDETSGSNDYVEFWSMRGDYEPRIVMSYTTDPTPEEPTLAAPDGFLEASPTTFSFSFPNTATVTAYDLKVGTTFGGSDLLNTVSSATGLSANSASVSYTGSTIPKGQMTYWAARGKNASGTYGSWGYGTFYVKNAPSAPTLSSPSSSKPYAQIWNLDAAAIWTGASAEAKPQVILTYNHPDGFASQAFEFEFSANGTDPAETVSVTRSVESGQASTFDVEHLISRNVSTPFRVRAQAVGGQWSAWTTTFNMKVNWAQGIFAHTHGAGAGDFEFTYPAISGGSYTDAAFLFRKSNGTPGPWCSSPGEVTPDTQMQVLVRLSTADSTQPPTLSSMTLTYSTLGDPVPDHWVASGAVITLDNTLRRFGRRSLRVEPSAAGYVRATNNGSALPVTPHTQYTWSIYVNTLGALTSNLVLKIKDSAGTVVHTAGADGTTSDSSTYEDGWQRISMSFTPSVSAVFPEVTWASDPGDFRLDSAQLEEYGRPTLWRPGAVGQAVSLDIGGVQVDASLGAFFRLKGALGGVLDTVELGDSGLLFGDVEIHNTGAGEVTVDGSLVTTGLIDVTGNSLITGTLNVTGSVTVGNLKPIVRTYTTTGANTWTKPAGLSHIIVECIGGGGGGGGGENPAANNYATAATGGGGGGYAQKLFTAANLAGASSFTATVGTGGTGATAGNNNGTAGGNSTFSGTGITTVTANGGGAGSGSARSNVATSKPGIAGGGASNGDLNLVGGASGMTRIILSGSNAIATVCSYGGTAARGGSGGLADHNAGGAAGQNYGGGGAGGAGTGNTGARAGGNGAQGVVVVTEYYMP